MAENQIYLMTFNESVPYQMLIKYVKWLMVHIEKSIYGLM
jgi:hypothetical protein